jgi:hypothetical protein
MSKPGHRHTGLLPKEKTPKGEHVEYDRADGLFRCPHCHVLLCGMNSYQDHSFFCERKVRDWSISGAPERTGRGAGS